MQVGKLLYVTDFGQPSFSEVERLVNLRSLGVKEVIFLHATKAEGWERRVDDYGIDFKTLMVEGPTVASILDTARKEGVSLIVTKLIRGKTRLLRGSLITDLLRASTLPVLILPEDAEASGSMERGIFANLIFATDWSPASEKALNYLLSLNLKAVSKSLEIVHVIDKKLSVRDIHYLQYKLKESRRILMDHGLDAEAHVYAGTPSAEIMLAAKDYDGTCIVIGTIGKSTVKDFFSSSCSYRVAEESVVPTLVVP